MGILKDVKKAVAKQKKMQKKLEKTLGIKPEKKAVVKAEKEHVPKDYRKTYKLTGVNKALYSAYIAKEPPFDEWNDIDIDQNEDGKWEVICEEHILGYLPSSANAYMDNHFDDFQDAELDEEGVHLDFFY